MTPRPFEGTIMVLKFRYTFQPGQFLQVTKSAYDPIADAATAAMQDVAEEAQILGRASMAAAGFSRKFQSALRFKVFPKRGKKSASPAALIYSKIDYAGIFEEGGTIAGKPLLWLPLPDAPRGRGGKKIPAGEYRQFVGWPLYSIKRPGKLPLLGANVRQTSTRSKGISLAMLKRGRNPGGKGTERLVPLYFGIPRVQIEKKFSVEGAAKAAFASYPTYYYRHFTGD
jgi:hypothetical protein